uniref:putative ferric-chelate reductase 1 n=1 Tax=Monopterus albus TaxID=43700 RepID=UPI0009B4AF7A|nr:putative ferric-chelate reductase 1 [Monopterus albus]
MDRIVLMLLCVAPVVQCYKSGLVTASCGSLHPNHNGNAPQTGASPFTITTDRNSCKVGEDVKVTLQGQSQTYDGFLLQARIVGGQSPVGTFTLIPTNAQLLTCSQKADSVSHKDGSAKNTIQVTWKPDASLAGENIQLHATFVKSYNTFWVDVTSPVLNVSSDTNAVTKVCFSKPSGCDPAVSAGCYFMSAKVVSPNNAAIRYEMTGSSDGYISIGFSDDQIMGNDDIYICSKSSTGTVVLQHAFSTGRKSPTPVSLGNVSDVIASVQNGVLSCIFTTTNSISTQRSTGSDSTYYIMFAYGPASNGNVYFHRDTFVSSEKIDITKAANVESEETFPPIIKAHGSLMLIAWMTTGSVGMLVARYLKGMSKGTQFCGKDIWFLVHAALMCLTVAATIIAFILAFSYAQDWSGGAHPVLGCLVMILSFFQPIVALLRCAPQHPKRYLFNWSHAINAVAIKALAVAAIFTGLSWVDVSANQWMPKVMGGFFGWEILFFILFDVHFKWKVNRPETLGSKVTSTDTLLIVLYFLGNFCFLVALLVGIGRS